VTLDVLDKLIDPKDKLQSRIFMKKVETLLQSGTQTLDKDNE